MKIIFNDATELVVQSASIRVDGSLLIKTISATEEELRTMFQDKFKTQKMTVTERESTVATYENYTNLNALVKYIGGILGVVIYREKESPMDRIDALEEHVDNLTEANKSREAETAELIATVDSILTDVLPALLGGEGMFADLLGGALKIVKIVTCIYLFRVLMLRFFNTVQTDYARLQRYGLKVALFSSIVVAGFSILQILVINPEMMTQTIHAVQNAYQNMMDSNTMAAMEKMISKLPVITFFSSLIYCYLWGWILSTTFARRLFPVNPFGERDSDDESNNLQ